jgi:hypothetical protein
MTDSRFRNGSAACRFPDVPTDELRIELVYGIGSAVAAGEFPIELV